MDIGEIGHSEFSRLCAISGLVANRSQIDVTGWDFIVQERAPTKPKNNEMHEVAIEYKIQVKATCSSSGRVQFKVSTLLNLCRSSSPCFIVIVKLCKDGMNSETRIIHVDKTFMEKVWKRAYEENNSLFAKPLSKISISVNASVGVDLAVNFKGDIAKCFSSFIPNGMESYSKEKSDVIKKLGLENGGYSLSFNASKDQWENIIKAHLGYETSASVSGVVSHVERFGIKMKDSGIPDHDGNAVINIKPPGMDVTLRFISHSGEYDVDIGAKMYMLPHILSTAFDYSSRIASDEIEVLINFEKGKANFRIGFSDNEISLGHAAKVSRIMRIVDSDSGSDLEICMDGNPLVRMNVPKAEFDPSTRSMYTAISKFRRILDQFGGAGGFSFRYDELWDSIVDIRQAYALMYEGGTATLNVEINESFDFSTIEDYKAIVPSAIGVGEHIFLLLFEASVKFEPENSAFILSSFLPIKSRRVSSTDDVQTVLDDMTSGISSSYDDKDQKTMVLQMLLS